MPFIRTSVHRSTAIHTRQTIIEGIHHALVEAIGMPSDELFNQISEYTEETFFYSRSFNGIARSDRIVVIELTMRRGRSDAMKRDLYMKIADHLKTRAGISPKDVFIFTHENDYSDWSVGNGAFAMALQQQRGHDFGETKAR